ncbi:MAG: carbon-nitrogen hydrolase [Gemmataceae bacterium]|nr:carbon-nitrogen hydrolase [Gemmataceae bacterium]MDW8264566.1 carbon-nitrogen hydrolase [Gemmataceae bacterium]
MAAVADQFTVALVQMRCGPNPEENLRRALAQIEAAAASGTDVVCLPELFRTPYFCQREAPEFFDLAEPIPGPTSERLAEAARRAGVVVVASLFERRSPGVYHNTAVVFDTDGSLLGRYRKMHIPDDPLYYEKYYFTPGDLGFQVFQTRRARIGTLVCWDQWFPEAARLTALRGAEILVYPTAIGWHPREKAAYGTVQHQAWELMQRSHAIANGVWVAAVNRVGHEGPSDGGLEFWGASFVCDPFGVVVARASHDREELLLATCDRRRIETTRRHWPFLRDRRIDAYADLARRWLE